MSGYRLGNIAILGSSGSVGEQTLEIVRANRDRFQVTALAACRDVEKVCAQAAEFSPQLVAMADPDAAAETARRLGDRCRVVAGEEGVLEAAQLPEVHTVVGAVVGFAGLNPVLAAIAAGKHVALANKESLVSGGNLLRRALAESASMVVPVDSEHSSIFQCLRARKSPLRKIILTATGGPFLRLPIGELEEVTAAQAVRHPVWSMGAKISVDSASLMNKGLEVIEAAELFELDASRIEVLVHPQAVIHGLVQYDDGSTLAAMFQSDMRVPICYALSYLYSEDPKTSPGNAEIRSGAPYLDLAAAGQLEFFEPDLVRFPALALCYRALETGKSMPAVLNAANEAAVERFMRGNIGFLDIGRVVEQVMSAHRPQEISDVSELQAVDSWARSAASNCNDFPRRPATAGSASSLDYSPEKIGKLNTSSLNRQTIGKPST